MRVITAHLFILFPDKILFDHHILVPVADLPFSQASFSTEKPLSTAGICEAVDIAGYFTPHPCICEKAWGDILHLENQQQWERCPVKGSSVFSVLC